MKVKTENLFARTRLKTWPYIHFKKENLYKLFFQCLIIGFLAFVFETLVNLIMNGELVDRGFLYGPFIPLYAISLFFYLLFFNVPVKSVKNFVFYFFTTAIVITLIELSVGNLCEVVFKSELWNYEDILFSATYISLPISLIWGLLATIYLMFLVPLIKKISDKIRLEILYKVVHYAFILLCIDMIASIIVTIKEGIYEEKYYFYDGIPIFLFVSGLFFYFSLVIVIGRFVIAQFKHQNKWIGIFFYPPYIISLFLPLFAMYDYLFRVKSHFIDQLAIIGFFTLAIYIYFFMTFLLSVLVKKVCFIRHKDKENNYITLSAILLSLVISLSICIYGVQQVKNSVVTTYTIHENQLKENYRIVALADVHYGSTGSIINMKKMVSQINQLDPDLVLFLGDTIDNRLAVLDQETFVTEMKQINSRYGKYAIVGNHDIQLNSYDALKYIFSRAGITLLLDESKAINEDFTLIGRIDFSAERKEISEINLENASLPAIVLDHQPQTSSDAKETQAFLQLSGHTHQGQLFPFNLFLKAFYYLNFDKTPIYGIQKRDDEFSLIVSRGYGNWGFPLRTTGPSEIMVIELQKE